MIEDVLSNQPATAAPATSGGGRERQQMQRTRAVQPAEARDHRLRPLERQLADPLRAVNTGNIRADHPRGVAVIE